MSDFRQALRAALFATAGLIAAAYAQTPTPPSPAATPSAANPFRAPPPETVQVRPITANVTVTDEQLLRADTDTNNWLLNGRTYDNQRFSPLKQINASNVKNLHPVAIVQTGVAISFEATPIVVNGVMYVSTPGDHVLAFNATTGEPYWTYIPTLGYSQLCCGPQSRGVVVAYGKVYLARLDGILVALDAKSGKVAWQSNPATTLPDSSKHYSFTTAPQVYGGMVVVGTSGAELPIRGFVQAYDAETGKLIWRFNTTASPDDPGGNSWAGDSWKVGGGSVWNAPAFDPQRGLISFGVGNPNPDIDGNTRKGDNAYSDSIVAVNAKSGKLAWWYQQVPHDLWDFDSASPVIFLDSKDENGKVVPAAAEANKEGSLYIVNRETGKLLHKTPFVLESANKFTPPSDTPGQVRYPGANGGGEWSPSAYSSLTHDIYVLGSNVANIYEYDPIDPAHPPVGLWIGGRMYPVFEGKEKDTFDPWGTLAAVDADTGKIAWQYRSELPMVGGPLVTASNLLFTGEMNGNFDAFDAKTGKKLWHFFLGAGVNAPPITYRVNGVQYLAVAAGGNSGNGDSRLAAIRGYPAAGDLLAIFTLNP